MSSTLWTDQEVFLLKKYYPTGGTAVTSKYINRSKSAILGKAFSLGIKFNAGPGVLHTNEWYLNELLRKEIYHIPLEPYKGYDTPIEHECINEHRTLRTPNNVLRGGGCTICLNLDKKNSETYLLKLNNLGIQYIPLEEYINTDTSIKHQCPKCNLVWMARPSHILNGHGCPKCKRPGGYNLTFFNNNPEIAKQPGICYLLVLIDKETKKKVAYKIGITKGSSNKDVLKRIKQFGVYDANILKVYRGTLLEVFNLEQSLHVKWNKYKLVPNKKFGGMQECFEIETMILKTFPNI